MSDTVINPVAAPIGEAAKLAGVSRDTIQRAVNSGELPMHFPTARGLILIEDLRAWIKAAPTANPRRVRRA